MAEERFTESELQELAIEDLASLVEARSFDVLPETAGEPGVTEEGSVAEASASMVPPGVDPTIAPNLDLAAQRRQAANSRLKNLRMEQDIQTESM